LAIEKARQVGAGFVTVRNSNHYGIAGYYSMMALEHDCIGFSMTNAAVLVLPTFGRDAVLGTNPISVAAPAGEERAFVLDMATSTVPRGKLEVYDRQEKPLPIGWATDEQLAGPRMSRACPPPTLGECCATCWRGRAADSCLWAERTRNWEVTRGTAWRCWWMCSAACCLARGTPPASILRRRMASRCRRTWVTSSAQMADERRAQGIPLHPKVVAELRKIAEETEVEYNL
jgi:hypothetical protein